MTEYDVTEPLWVADPNQAEVIYLEQVDSTNRFLADLVRSKFVQQYTTVWAGHQTAGRGRYQRKWVDSGDHSLLITTYMSVPDEYLSWVTLLAGMAMRKALGAGEINLKWPNDLLLNKKKVAGILSERIGIDESSLGNKSHKVIVGIGVNLGITPSVPGGYPGAVPGIRPEERMKVIRAYLQALSDYFQMTTVVSENPQGGVESVQAAWREEYLSVLAGKDQEVTVREADGAEHQVTLVGVNLDGSLIVSEAGTERSVYTGDVALSGQPLPPM